MADGLNPPVALFLTATREQRDSMREMTRVMVVAEGVDVDVAVDVDEVVDVVVAVMCLVIGRWCPPLLEQWVEVAGGVPLLDRFDVNNQLLEMVSVTALPFIDMVNGVTE